MQQDFDIFASRRTITTPFNCRSSWHDEPKAVHDERRAMLGKPGVLTGEGSIRERRRAMTLMMKFLAGGAGLAAIAAAAPATAQYRYADPYAQSRYGYSQYGY